MSIRFPLATTTWDVQEHQAMQNVIASGMFTMGPRVAEFENAFAKYIGSKYAVMVNSGSSANLLMVAALFYSKNSMIKLKAGDEILVPAVSWSTTYFPLYQHGLKLKFVDIDIDTLNYDLDQLEQAISEKTRAIMVVNLLGNPNDFYRIEKMISDRQIVIIEDNCESLGAVFGSKKTGTFGVMGTFSSFFSHHMSTMEGGLVVTDNQELYQILLSLRAHGWTRNLPKDNLVCSLKSDNSFEESFRFVLPGYNLRPLEMSGAIGIEQLKKLPRFIEERRKNAVLFQKTLNNHPDILIQSELGESSWFGFSLVIRPESSLLRKDLLRRLEELGFECRPIVAGNFVKNEVIKFFDYEIYGKLKNAEHIDKYGLFIGNHHYSMQEAIFTLSKI